MKKRIALSLVWLLIGSLACSLPLSFTRLPAPTLRQAEPLPPQTLPLPTPAPTVAPLSVQWPLLPSISSESGRSPDYSLKTELPVMQGDDVRVRLFNAETQALVMQEVQQFKTGLAGLPEAPIGAGSAFESAYSLDSPPGPVMSLAFGFYVYMDGAAHPYTYTLTYTYDLQRGEQIRLEQLFQPGADYLTVIADYCKRELSQREIGFEAVFVSGADPTPENYHNWTITPEGLLIYFDPYQVAPYASGPQQVNIPYAALREIIHPQGALGPWR